MKTLEEMESMPYANRSGEMQAVTLQEVFATISSNTIIIKMDIEGYECKVSCNTTPFTSLQALQPPVLLGEGGKVVPIVLLEWAKVARWDGMVG